MKHGSVKKHTIHRSGQTGKCDKKHRNAKSGNNRKRRADLKIHMGLVNDFKHRVGKEHPPWILVRGKYKNVLNKKIP